MNKRQLEDREVVIWNEVMKARRKSNKHLATAPKRDDYPYKVIRTASDAQEYLRNNTSNRSPNTRHVERLARDIKDGNWSI